MTFFAIFSNLELILGGVIIVLLAIAPRLLKRYSEFKLNELLSAPKNQHDRVYDEGLRFQKKTIDLTTLQVNPDAAQTTFSNHENKNLRIQLIASEQQLAAANEQLIAAMEQLNDTNQRVNELSIEVGKAHGIKNAFLTNISHEIRTPLNAIIGMTDLVFDTELSDFQKEQLTVVNSAGETLLNLVDNILDFANIDSGKIRLNQNSFDIRMAINKMIKAVAGSAHVKGLEIETFIHDSVPVNVAGDQTRLKQILLNLIGNAIKFTEKGSVIIEVREAETTGENNVRLAFTIKDTGIGILQEDQTRILKEFVQVDSSTTRKYGGAGLGLTISHKLIQLMHGELFVKSFPGKGSEFHFTVTVKKSDSKIANYVYEKVCDTEQHALVVHPQAECLNIISDYLQQWNFKVDVISNADAITNHDKQFTKEYDLLIFDKHFGYDLLEQTLQKTGIRPTSGILLVKIQDLPEEFVLYEHAGIEQFVWKPLEKQFLYRAVLNVFYSGAPQISPNKDVDETELPSQRILLLEDDLTSAKLARQILEKAGHLMEEAENDIVALKTLSTESFDVIFINIEMSETDGIAVAKEIRDRDKITGLHTPIIALKDRYLGEDLDKCFAAGIDDYVTKPLRKKQLDQTLRNVLKATATA